MITALVKRRRDLQAKADYLDRQAVLLRTDMLALDNAIKVIDPDFNLSSIKIKRFTPQPEHRPHYQAVIIQLLRTSDRPMTIAELTTEYQKEYQKKYSCEFSQKERNKLRERIKGFMSRQLKKGFVAKEGPAYRLTLDEVWNALE